MNLNTLRLTVPDRQHKTTIIPIEAHYSNRARSNGFCKDLWYKLLNRIEKDPNCYAIFVGDIIDSHRPSQRAMNSAMYSDPDRTPALEEEDLDHQAGLRAGIIKDLKRIKNKILGMVDGDHFRLYANKTTSTWYIANQLGIPQTYLGERMGWVKIIFSRDIKKNYSSFDFNILVRHGKGGGNIGGDVNKLISQNTGFIADLFVGGHTHKQWFYKIPHIYPGHREIRQKLVGYARAGSLLRGFMYGEGTYAERCEYSPLSIGWPEIYLTTTRQSGILELHNMQGLS